MKVTIARRPAIVAVALLSGAILCGRVRAQAPQGKPVTVRGKISAVDKQSLKIQTSAGEVMVRLPDKVTVAGVEAAKLSDISAGNYIGTAAVKQPDGSLKALEVHIFPESARGTREGHRPWDLQAGSTMTNANVEKVQPRTVARFKGSYSHSSIRMANKRFSFLPGRRSLRMCPATVRF